MTDIITWGLITYLWQIVEGEIMPVAAFIIAMISLTTIYWVAAKKNGRNLDFEKNNSREVSAIFILMVFSFFNPLGIRWI